MKSIRPFLRKLPGRLTAGVGTLLLFVGLLAFIFWVLPPMIESLTPTVVVEVGADGPTRPPQEATPKAGATKTPLAVVVTATPIRDEVISTPPATPRSRPAEEPVTLYEYAPSDPSSFDPQRAVDAAAIAYAENLFVSLTNTDLHTGNFVPEAALSWDISPDGLMYTFHLRSDIPWVYHNPVTGETRQVQDEVGRPRFVTADDFVYSIRRLCDPYVGDYYSSVIAPVILGCADVFNYGSQAPQALIEAIGVSALDKETLVIQMEYPTGYFLSLTSMWTMAATPQWTIEAYGEKWTEAGTIVTNGRFVLSEWIHNTRLTVQRNPFMPADMLGEGNIERRVEYIVPDKTEAYGLWLNNQLDTATVPEEELETHLDSFPSESQRVSDHAVFYFGVATTKPPFDDVRVRQAFSAAFDRATYIAEVRQGQGLPMRHFAPPGMFGAPAIDEVGVGFDPEYAREQLAAAGYPQCEGFPVIHILGYTGQSTLNWLEFSQATWEKHLGCDPDLLTFEQLPFAELLAATSFDAPLEDVPHLWTLGWGPDYLDENNWVGDVLWCHNIQNRSRRSCNETDDLIEEARVEINPERRQTLYRQIEEAFFGAEGEFPIIPLFMRVHYQAVHSWYRYIPAVFGGEQWYNGLINQEIQQVSRQ